MDYTKLNNPFSESKEEANTTESIQMDDMAYITTISDGPLSLREAKNSEKWPTIKNSWDQDPYKTR